MGFLDNSGDIILDAVLTDAGRARLAKGDCSFNIAKFALGDDECNYGLYNNQHESGSQYYDLEILQSPILEAFTNNTSTMNSKLISNPRNNIYYLPVIKLFDQGNYAQYAPSASHIVAVNKPTVDKLMGRDRSPPENKNLQVGILNGYQPGAGGVNSSMIGTDQGIDNVDKPPETGIASDLRETTYIVTMDNRLATMTQVNGAQQTYAFLDDDQIASYYLTLSSPSVSAIGTDPQTPSSILGSRGTRLSFKLKASLDLEAGTSLFSKIGGASTVEISNADGYPLTTYYYIDSTIRIVGATTGYRVDIPVKFVRTR